MLRPRPALTAAIIFFGGLTLYTITLAQSVLTADNGEFQWIGATLGLAHPPGFPLYTALAFLFSKLPFWTAAVNISWFSAVSGAFVLIIVYYTTLDLIPDHPRPSSALIGSAIAALALATSTTFWAQATTANIRMLTALFAALALWALVRLAASGPFRSPWFNPLAGFALAIGFGLTHHLSLAFMALVMGIFALWIGRDDLKQPKMWGVIALYGAFSAVPWVYLLLIEPELRSWQEFWTYALGLGFRGDFFYFRTLPELVDRLVVMGNVLMFQFSPIVLIGAAAGWVLLLRRRLALGLLLGGVFAVHTLITATYRAPQTVEYMLPAYLPVVISLGFSVRALMDGMGEGHRWRLAARWAIPVLFIAVALGQGVARYPSFAYLSSSSDTQDYVNQILAGAPENAAVLAEWHWYTPLKYAQDVNGARPDVDILFVFPQSADYGRDWATAIDQVLDDGRAVVATHFDENAYRDLPSPTPLAEAYLFAAAPPLIPAENLSPPTPKTSLKFISWEMSGQGNADLSEGVTIHVAWELIATAPDDLRLYAQLISPDGRLVAQDNQAISAEVRDLNLSRFRLHPFAGTPPGLYRLVVGAYVPDDPEQRDELTLTEIEVHGSSWRPVTLNPVQWAQPAAKRTLVGYDWDNTLPGASRLYLHWQLENGRYWSETIDLPPDTPLILNNVERGFSPPDAITLQPASNAHYVPFGQGIVWLGNQRPLAEQSTPPGSELFTTQRFAAAQPVARDIGFAVRLIGLQDDDYTWAWLNPDDDADIPAMGAIPTLKWIAGSEIHHPRRLTIPDQAVAGQRIEGFLRPYDVFTNAPLPILDNRLSAAGKQWVPFDSAAVEEP